MFIRHCCKRLYSTKVPVDEQCLPLKPTWSIKLLFQSKEETISDDQFKHLLSLARLNIQDKERQLRLKQEISQLGQLTASIKYWNEIDGEPLTHIWKQDLCQPLRDDDQIEINDEIRGRDLFPFAKKKSGHFYIVPGSSISSTE
ncbi:uncharacterized protein BX663DRAFT_498526 [Cokeromyces recurvatus]|uniref:uncharacterized protein n=1 Tax=Cokeromyces recurvatus TaxID=90255 RepID=UPI00221E56AA|nr:uncharacterized protein BX663DRAFT_498526 [Cokeromyces recurvatus]KAI7906022.1 hypothetical protein BX663DRAFT_498526 [Cokeromyces recurvatus]